MKIFNPTNARDLVNRWSGASCGVWSLVEKIIKYSSNTGDKVMDMFLGGFTTARVGLELGREPLGFEVNNKSFNHFYPRFHLKR